MLQADGRAGREYYFEKRTIVDWHDNHCPNCRKVVAEIPQDLLITDYELALIETHLGAMIANLLNSAVNDNIPMTGPDRRETKNQQKPQ